MHPSPTLHLLSDSTSPYNHHQNSMSPQYQQQTPLHLPPALHNNNNNNNHPQYKYNNNNNINASSPPTNALYPPISRLMYVPPLTPPSSEPGSPGGALPRRTPPPPYPVPCQGSTGGSISRIGGTGVKYNRRNNPELEKRRIHHCDFLGKEKYPQKSIKDRIFMYLNCMKNIL